MQTALLILFFSLLRLSIFAQETVSCFELKEGFILSCSKLSYQISKTESFYLGDIVFYEEEPKITAESLIDSVLRNGTLIQISPYTSKYRKKPKGDIRKQYLNNSLIEEITTKDSVNIAIRKVIILVNVKKENLIQYIQNKKGYNNASFLDKNDINSKLVVKVYYPELILSNK